MRGISSARMARLPFSMLLNVCLEYPARLATDFCKYHFTRMIVRMLLMMISFHSMFCHPIVQKY